NRTRLSSYFKLFEKMDAEHRYDYWLDLHQMMFIDSRFEDNGYSCQMFLPIPGLEAEDIAAENVSWANDITQAWLDLGFAAALPHRSGYSGEQAESCRKTYGDIHRRMN